MKITANFQEVYESDTLKFSAEYENWTKRRWLKLINCEHCGESFWDRFDKKGISYCSQECMGLANRNRVTLTCDLPSCDNAFERTLSKLELSKSGYFFCSRKCKDLAQSLAVDGFKEMMPEHYGTKELSRQYRKIALVNHEHKCINCGWKPKNDNEYSMLDVHHIDHNHDNCAPENLQFLCAWCHQYYHRIGVFPNMGA